MRRMSVFLAQFAVATALWGAPPRLTFVRVLAAPQDLGGAREVAVTRAVGEAASLEDFVETFVEQINQSRTLRAVDARKGGSGTEARVEIAALSCSATERDGEGSARDAHGDRVKRTLHWVDATCRADIVLPSRGKTSPTSFSVRGQGTSTRVERVTDDERAVAVRQAARYAAVSAAEQIAPRRVRESIRLDEDAPAFDGGYALIETGRLAEARAAWERALPGNARSASLHFNLGAVCEALGDRPAAERHYATARDLAPAETRYGHEMKLFQARGAGRP